MKALMTICALLMTSLTASADPMGEKLALSCYLDDGQASVTKVVKLSSAKNEDGSVTKMAGFFESVGGTDFHVNVMGNKITINTILAGTAISSQGRDLAILQVLREGAENTHIIVECKLTN